MKLPGMTSLTTKYVIELERSLVQTFRIDDRPVILRVEALEFCIGNANNLHQAEDLGVFGLVEFAGFGAFFEKSGDRVLFVFVFRDFHCGYFGVMRRLDLYQWQQPAI